MWYWIFKYFPFYPLVRLGFRAQIKNKKNIPKKGAVILAANHLSNADPLVLPAMLNRRITFPAKIELFQGKNFRTKIVAWFMKAIGQVPVSRASGKTAVSSLNSILEILASGQVVAFFPEGTRSPDGRIYKGKTGVARMALAAKVPVIPVGIVGTEIRRGRSRIPWVKKPLIIVGEPLDFSEFYDYAGNLKVLRWVTDEIMAAIQHLSGQEYADVYGLRVKHGDLKNIGSDEFVIPSPGGQPKPDLPELKDS